MKRFDNAGTITRMACLAIVLTFAGGCVRLNQPAPIARSFRLGYAIPDTARSELPYVLQILSFTVSAAYDSQAMLYRDGEHRIGRFLHDRWVANPGNLIADALARDFAEDGGFRVVQTSRAPLVSDYKLSGEIEEFEEQIEAGRCYANLRLRILVVSLRASHSEPVALRRSYADRQESQCGDGASLAAAMSTTMNRISGAIRDDVHQAVAHHSDR